MTKPKRKTSKNPYTRLMTVTPAKAANWLESGNSHNRTPKERGIAILAKNIINGTFLAVPHAPIAFSPEGVLIDGQNRLTAIVRTNTAVDLYVCFNSPMATQAVTDRGTPRTSADVHTLGGKYGAVGHGELATLRAMLSGNNGGARLTDDEEGQLLAAYRDGIDFAQEHMGTRLPGISTGATRAAIARAYYHVTPDSHDRLSHFCEVLRSGVGGKGDASATCCFRTLLRAQRGHGASNRRWQYGVTERALRAYLDGEDLRKLYPASKELFPLPTLK